MAKISNHPAIQEPYLLVEANLLITLFTSLDEIQLMATQPFRDLWRPSLVLLNSTK